MPPALRIMVDVDGTLYDSDALFVRSFRRAGIPLRKEQISGIWDFWRSHMDHATFAAVIRDHFHHPEAIAANRPYAGAAEALRAWADLGAEIHIVSDRAAETTAATAAWVEQIGIPAVEVVCEDGIDKVAYARDIGVRVALDDKPSTLAGMAAAGLAGGTIVYPYNREVVAASPLLSGARSWPALRRRIEARCPHLRQRRG